MITPDCVAILALLRYLLEEVQTGQMISSLEALHLAQAITIKDRSK